MHEQPNELEQGTKPLPPTPRCSDKKIPLRPPIKRLGKVSFSPLNGENLRPIDTLTEKEMKSLADIPVTLEVVYGKTKRPLKEIAALQQGSLLRLDDLCDDLVDVYVNGIKIGRGEIIACEEQFGVKIVTLDS